MTEPEPREFRIGLTAVIALAVALALVAGSIGWLLHKPGTVTLPAPYAGTAGMPPDPDPHAPAITPGQIEAPLRAVLADLRASDARGIEAWVTAGYSAGLAELIDVTEMAGGTTPVNVNARRFATAASAYLAANGPDTLAEGWKAQYEDVRRELNALAGDCGLDPVPAPGWLHDHHRTGDSA